MTAHPIDRRMSVGRRSSVAREVEFKLEVAPAAVARWLPQKGNWSRLSPAGSTYQCSVYFDTPNLDLRNSGYSLRIRNSGGRFVQSLKSLGSGVGLFDRYELEQEIGSCDPDLEQLAGTPAGDFEKFKPIFRTEIERTSYRITRPGSEVEIDVDLGVLITANGTAPVSELEIELIEGAQDAAFKVAKLIAEEIPVKLAVSSKAERGFALTEPTSVEWVKAEPVELREGMRIAEGFSIIVTSCLRHFRLNEPFVTDKRNAEALHQCRVAIRRLRTALALFRPAVCGREFRHIHGELRWFFAESGDARNLDVYLKRKLSPDQRRFVAERREGACQSVIAAMDSARFRRLMLDLLQWSIAGSWRRRPLAAEPIENFLERRIDGLWSKVRRTRKVAGMGDRKRHRLRMKVKRLRYALEFIGALQVRKQGRRKSFERDLASLQESLGLLHDLVAGRALVALNSWIKADQSGRNEESLARDADRAIGRLLKAGPYWRT